jgi:hypothetical protein
MIFLSEERKRKLCAVACARRRHPAKVPKNRHPTP